MYELEVGGEDRISAPPEDVFDKLSDPVWVTAVMPGLIENRNVSRIPVQAGDAFDYTYEVFGVILHGKWHVDVADRPRLYKAHTDGDGVSEWEYQLRPDGQATTLEITVRYDMPRGVIGKAKAEFLKSINQKAAEHYLYNIKQYFELAG
jgi:carbon monoxide dehydrogenase subunit G